MVTISADGNHVGVFWLALSDSGEFRGTRLLDALPAYVRTTAIEQAFSADIQWSTDGLKSVLLVNGGAEAVYDFGNEFGMCRMERPVHSDFPWLHRARKWNDAIVNDFHGLNAGPAL